MMSYAGSITPTVELNGLAMKRGEPAIYRPLDPKPMPNYRANYNFRGMFNQRWAPQTELTISVPKLCGDTYRLNNGGEVSWRNQIKSNTVYFLLSLFFN